MSNSIWFGDEQSLLDMHKAMSRIDQNPDMFTRTGDETEEPQHHLLENLETLSIVNINGSLVTQNKWYNRHFGLVSYEEIMEAVSEAANDESTDAIYLKIASGGGNASGLKEAADFIIDIDKNVKPVYAFTDSAAFSAAYWLFSSAREGYVAEMGQLGSIGAISAHVSYKDMLDKAGIVYTVFREGEFKALGQPYEKLDDKAKQVFKEKLAKANSFFLNAVVQNRGLSLADQEHWGEGKTFYGAEAMRIGLADKVVPFHELVKKHMSNQAGDGRTHFSEDIPMPKKDAKDQGTEANVTGTEQAAEAAQASEAQAPEQQMQLPEEILAQLEAGAITREEAMKHAVPAQAEDTPEAEADMAEGEGEEPEVNASEVDAVAADNAELIALQEKLKTTEAELEASQGLCEKMKGIVLDAADRKTIAMGGAAIDLSHLDAATAVMHYEKVSDQMSASFKSGPTSVVETETDENLQEGTDVAGFSAMSAIQLAALSKS